MIALSRLGPVTGRPDELPGILRWRLEGTCHGMGVDPTGGLLRARERRACSR